MQVTTLVKDSPADLAGVQCGDIIVQFGEHCTDNFQGLKTFAAYVGRLSGCTVAIRILRRMGWKGPTGNGRYEEVLDTLVLKVKVGRWFKRGVVGCVVNCWPPPINHSDLTSSLTTG